MRNEFDFVKADHFRMAPNAFSARQLFKTSVVMVEVEVFSYCNRQCWFCPNSVVDRHSTNTCLPHSIYTGILRQLAEIDYSEQVSFSRYNEPLSDRLILDRIQEARGFIPHARLHTNTNGDYLSANYLMEIYEAGLRSMNVQIYLQNSDLYDHDRMRQRAQSMITKLGLPSVLVCDRPGDWLEYHLTYEDMMLRLYARNFEINGCSRGDTVAVKRGYVRTAPCVMPFRHVYVDYDGKVMPCCNLRSDVPEHRGFVVHDLALHNDLFAAYAQSPLVAWRRKLLGFQEKGGPCRSCFFPYFLQPPSPEEVAVQTRLQAIAQAVPCNDRD